MPEYLAPGLFVEEVDSGAKPIEGAGTNTAAFIGYAKSGDFNRPSFITNWTQFSQLYGEEENSITRALCLEFGQSVEEVRKEKALSRKGWTEYAHTKVQKAIDAKTASVPNWKAFCENYQIDQGGLPYIKGSYLAHSVRGFFDNGGGRCYIIRVPSSGDVQALGYQVSEAVSTVHEGLTFSLRSGVQGTDKVTVEISYPKALAADPKAAKPAKGATADAGAADAAAGTPDAAAGTPDAQPSADNTFAIRVTRGSVVEEFGFGKSSKDQPLTVSTVWGRVNAASKLISVVVGADATTRPTAKTLTLTPSAPSAPATPGATLPVSLPAGLDLTPADFVGDEAKRSGLGGMIAVEDANFIYVPDLMAGLFERDQVNGDGKVVSPEVLKIDDTKAQAILDAQCALVAHCERLGKRMGIVDSLPGLKPQEVQNLAKSTPWGCDRGQAAMYYPWIAISDPLNKGHQMWCPPGGHMAGVWARVASERGVHKAPANEAVRGAVKLEYELTQGEQAILNPIGVNCIRAFPGLGIRAWGARTLATETNPSWKYINIRRHFNYLEASLENGLRWTVFEPNDPRLWGRIVRDISSFLTVEWREGRLFGATPGNAYYVKCDSETNTQETIDLGRVYAEIGVNPVKPAEFVIIRIGQWTGGASISE